jgi:hypothetical protein
VTEYPSQWKPGIGEHKIFNPLTSTQKMYTGDAFSRAKALITYRINDFLIYAYMARKVC